MEIIFSARLRKLSQEDARLIEKYGDRQAKLIRVRLDELRAAVSLEQMKYLPAARCHELAGNLKGSLAVSLNDPYRLIFEIADDPIPEKPDGGLDWKRVTAIRVVGIRNYHD